jgi:two-component system KDP operon response regulator KdpE
MQEHVLVIDDDVTLGKLLAADLQPKGFKVSAATNGRDGLKIAYEQHPDLVIVDIMMPEMDGWQVVQRLREMCDVPIVMLSAKSEEEDIVKGFGLGADDYIRKPFLLRELEGRVRAVLRRVKAYEHETSSVYDDGLLRIDLERQQAWRRGQAMHFTPTEFRLLSSLVRRQGAVVPHKELLLEVWGPGYADATTCLSLYIRYIREKLEDNPAEPKYIQTKWGVGYWFAPNGHAGE